MSNYRCFQIELTRGYDYSAFREDLKKLYHFAGVKGENTVFLFSDTQVTTVLVCFSFILLIPRKTEHLEYITRIIFCVRNVLFVCRLGSLYV